MLSLLMLCIVGVNAQSGEQPTNNGITIYVQAEEAPFIWMWGAANGQDLNVGDWPGQNQLTTKWTNPDTGEEFWTWTFAKEVLPISFLFNNGEATGTKQTKDINNVTTDRYFILSWDDGTGNMVFEDITENYVAIPDAEVNTVTLVGNHNQWGANGNSQAFEVVEAGKTFKLTVDMTNVEVDENLWQFKFRPNGLEWVGYWDIYYNEEPVEGKVSKDEAPEWLGVSNDGNFQIDLGATEYRKFTITATWNGGKEAGKNWSFKMEAEGEAQEPDPVTDGITIYVKCDEAPFIWIWGAANEQDLNVSDWPGQNQLTTKWTDPDTGEEFWTWTFAKEVLPISFLFNNGEVSGTKQTNDVNSVSSDRYFTLTWDDGDGNIVFEDITEQHGVVIPNAEVNTLTLAGNHNGWSQSVQEFEVVEEGKTFLLTVDLTDVVIEDDLWKFKLCPNGSDWVGFWQVAIVEPAPEWCYEAAQDGNFEVNLYGLKRTFVLTATWAGGKISTEGWSLKIEGEQNTDNISDIMADHLNSTVIYNLQGQRLVKAQKGLNIINGKKVYVM